MTIQEQVQAALRSCAETHKALEPRLAATFAALAQHITEDGARQLRALLR